MAWKKFRRAPERQVTDQSGQVKYVEVLLATLLPLSIKVARAICNVVVVLPVGHVCHKCCSWCIRVHQNVGSSGRHESFSI